jgi:hypothetical protein
LGEEGKEKSLLGFTGFYIEAGGTLLVLKESWFTFQFWEMTWIDSLKQQIIILGILKVYF